MLKAGWGLRAQWQGHHKRSTFEATAANRVWNPTLLPIHILLRDAEGVSAWQGTLGRCSLIAHAVRWRRQGLADSCAASIYAKDREMFTLCQCTANLARCEEQSIGHFLTGRNRTVRMWHLCGKAVCTHARERARTRACHTNSINLTVREPPPSPLK